MRILITGGAGFVGSSLARAFRKAQPESEVVVLDNLRRRGAELNAAAFAAEGITFCHGDIRQKSDLEDLAGNFDLLIEASAEPSVHAGTQGSPAYVLETNLIGAMHCLEFARGRAGAFVFLSTSRVYSIAPLRTIAYTETDTRFVLAAEQTVPGVSQRGVSEDFPTDTARSYYGASKLASEILIQEYAESAHLPAIINRCGVIAGPGQFGRTDQGVFTLWMANHFFGRPLRYTGFGGQGKQVRDLLHPADLFELLTIQLESVSKWRADRFNVGGGSAGSISLRELTELCRELTGNCVDVGSDSYTAAVDVPIFITDTTKVEAATGWKPARSVVHIMKDVLDWLKADGTRLRGILC
jgi:CDP-paratose 2-epimerase